MECSNCGKFSREGKKFCINCGQALNSIRETKISLKETYQPLVKFSRLKILGWFILTNAAAIISLSLISGGGLIPFIPIFLGIGALFPFFGLLFSKHFIKKAHKVKIIGNGFNEYTEIQNMVYELSKKAGVKKMPEVGIYYDNTPNAFATGWRKDSALVAFSTGLIQLLDREEIEAVAGHEIAHVVNGDMITMTIIQSVINSLVLVITLPFMIFKILAFFSDEVGIFTYWIISAIKALVAVIGMFLGSIVVKLFSRNREFKADVLASKLVNDISMISALEKLNGIEIVKSPKELQAYASLKIVSSSAIFDVFSTHPSIERRIKRLTNIASIKE